VNLRRCTVNRKKTMLVLPSTKGAFDHPVVKDFSIDYIVVAGNPFPLDGPYADLEPGFLPVFEGSSSQWSDSFPFRHDSSECPRAVIPLPYSVNRHLKLANVFVGRHLGSSSLVSGVKRGA
jgi:hypothetical protein